MDREVTALDSHTEWVLQVMRQLGKDSYPLRRLFMLFDTNRNGFIDSEELIQGFQKLHPQGEAAVQCE